MPDTDKQLIMTVTAAYKGAVGFGEIFDCQIKKVIAGTISEPRIRLCILPKDRDKLNFLSAHPQPIEIEIRFKMIRTDEPYGLAPITGFVDQSKTSWGIEFMREVKE